MSFSPQPTVVQPNAHPVPHPPPSAPPAEYVREATEPPVIEMQPWARRLNQALRDMTYGIVRVDLTRPVWQRMPGPRRMGGARVRGATGYNDMDDHWEYASQPTSSIIQGARIKGMRYVGFGPKVPSGRNAVDLGVGLNLDMMKGRVQPSARLRLMDVVRLKVFPEPTFKLKHDFPIFQTGMVARVTYHQPLSDLNRLGKTGAWNVSFARATQNAIHFSPDRIEITSRQVTLGDNLQLWFTGDITYPRALPARNWQEQCQFIPTRIGLKIGW